MQITAINDEALWPAVVRRERAADGQFSYSVQTTKNERACWIIPAGFVVTRQRPTFPPPHGSRLNELPALC